MLRVGDMLLFAGTDIKRAYAGYVGHVEMVHAIDGSNVTLCGHGSGNPKTKEMRGYLRTRYNAAAPTPIGNQGLIKVVRYIQDDGTEGAQAPSAGTQTTAEPAPNAYGGEDKVTITGGSVYIRKGPGTDYGALMIARKGNSFQKIDTEGWTAIRQGDALRWISSKYVKDGRCTGGTVNIRKGPGTAYAAVGCARMGDALTVVDTAGWVPILIDSVIYWVSGKYAE